MLCSLLGYAQDIHWSQYFSNPLYLNPAFSGDFDGDIRLVANYRDQYRSVTKPFNTIALSGDFKMEQIPQLAFGAQLFHDVAGDGSLRTFDFKLAPSYHLFLGRDSSHRIRAGMEISGNSRSLDPNAFYYDKQFDGIKFDPSIPSSENFATSQVFNLNAGLGLSYQKQFGKGKSFLISTSFNNLLRPNQSFFQAQNKRMVRTTLFSQMELPIPKTDLIVLPSLLVQFQGSYRELILGSRLRYTLENRMGAYRALDMGLFLRNNDALYVNLGIHYNRYYGAISYDFNVSKLNIASNYRGGLEMSFRYIIVRIKAKNNHYRICPDFI